jgi:hypothetical protein
LFCSSLLQFLHGENWMLRAISVICSLNHASMHASCLDASIPSRQSSGQGPWRRRADY